MKGVSSKFELTARRAHTATERDFAMEAARLIKSKNPHSMVEVKDLKSGDVTAVALRRGERCH